MATATIATAAPLPAGDLLAKNTVIAQYIGTQHIPCRHLTALCPDRCDHATDIAEFIVVKNLDYQKDGEYGQEKADAGSIVRVDIKKTIEGQDPSVAKQIKALKPNQEVEVTITHFYVNSKGNRYPIYPATSFKALDKIGTLKAPATNNFVAPMAR